MSSKEEAIQKIMELTPEDALLFLTFLEMHQELEQTAQPVPQSSD